MHLKVVLLRVLSHAVTFFCTLNGRLATANTSIDLLLWACRKYYCCTYNICEITPIYNIHESPHSRLVQVELGKVEGFWSTLQLLQQALAKYLIVEQQAHLLLMWNETNHLCHVNNNVIISDWEPMPVQLEFHDRTLYSLHFFICF